MSEIKWMPGPWEQWNDHGSQVVTRIKSADRAVICTLAEGTDAWVNAHARLLKAAPDLYEALRQMVGAFGGVGETTSPALQQALAALAKAEGRNP